ncbi:MAG: hypothetical protein RIR69_1018 [Actinomycetota bacterium]|jgi:alpha-1,3-rhamnosyl/mannosyltransferase
MTKRIAVNLLWCVPGVGGSEEYLLRQLRGTHENQHDFVIDVFAPKGFSQRLPEFAGQFAVHEAPSMCHRRAVRIVLEHTWLAWRTRTYDAVHHGGGTMPKIGNRRTVLTLHDVQWTKFPEYFSSTKLKYLRRVVPSSLRRARRIAVPSHFVASTLVDNFAIAMDKISVVRHGVENDVVTDATPESELRRRWSLENARVLVYPAITHPHKNHLFLLELMSGHDSDWSDESVKIVCAGSAGSADQQVRDFINAHHLGDRVVMPGRISARDRNGALAMCEAMVFPSQYEGFGAPLVEAMHAGAPIVASDCASIPEVVGTAGVIVPLQQEAWVDALSRVRIERTELIARGRERAAHFTTALSGQDLLTVYRVVVELADS